MHGLTATELHRQIESLLERDFDMLLVDHGEPLRRGAKAVIRAGIREQLQAATTEALLDDDAPGTEGG